MRRSSRWEGAEDVPLGDDLESVEQQLADHEVGVTNLIE